MTGLHNSHYNYKPVKLENIDDTNNILPLLIPHAFMSLSGYPFIAWPSLVDFPSADRPMGSPPSLRRQLASTVILVPRVPDHGVMFRAEIAGAIWMIYSGNLDPKGIVAGQVGQPRGGRGS